jgi:hypothetical protein
VNLYPWIRSVASFILTTARPDGFGAQIVEEAMKQYIPVFLIIIIIAVTSSACRQRGGEVEPATSDTLEATAVARPEPDVATDMPPPSADHAGLTSYRSHTVTRPLALDGFELETECEVIVEPFAMRQRMFPGEVIVTEEGAWRWDGRDWFDFGLSPEETALMYRQPPSALWAEMGVDGPAWPSGIEYLADQGWLAHALVEGALTPAGRDNINGIDCQQYTVAADYSQPPDGHVEAAGLICVADQPGLPAVVIWAEIEQTLHQGYEILRHAITYEMAAVNPPLVIEAPTDFVVHQSEWVEDGAGDWDDPSADYLVGLESYRLVMVSHSVMQGQAITLTVAIEWMREPLAYHYSEDDGHFRMEWVFANGKGWMRYQDGDWEAYGYDMMRATGADLLVWHEDRIDLSQFELTGTAVVHGINCRHYQFDQGYAYGEQWVADQPDLPSMIVRRLAYSQEPGGQTGFSELNVYDINQPLAIEPPE